MTLTFTTDDPCAELRTCGECRFWDAGDERRRSTCHRTTPHIVHGWPTVRSVDWCGEFAPRVSAACRAALTAALDRVPEPEGDHT